MSRKQNVPRETLPVPLEQKQLKKIGRAFRNARLDRFQLKEVAEMSGVTYLTISKIEKGQLQNCSLKVLNSIAAALGVRLTITVESNIEAEEAD